MAVSKRLRYEVLRRDNFTCRYCRATDGVLTVDHVVPVALGGCDEPANLVAACRDCNAGKAASSPDQPLVDDVQSDAVRWAAAMREVERRTLDLNNEYAEWVDKMLWNWDISCDESVMLGDGSYASYPRPPDVEASFSLDTFLRAGLPNFEIMRLMDRTLSARQIGWDGKWRYFCGSCWGRLRDMHKEARTLIDQGVV